MTPYFAHEGFFIQCAGSVSALIGEGQPDFEWIVVNDDPSMADDHLLSLIPEALRRRTRLVSDGQNHGITRAQNAGISEARNPWVVLLDCDDLLEPHALRSLSTAIRGNPGCRYFSSLMVDIDDEGKELRRRRDDTPLSDMFAAGMIAGHMVAFRRDLFDDLGGFDLRFSGVQDYDFALRASALEPISRISEHLYRYRWHTKTQSVRKMDRQNNLANAVRSAFLYETLGLGRQPSDDRAPLAADPRAICVIRTQGNRMELLEEAVASVREQAITMVPCIVVHGDARQFDFVRNHLPPELGVDHPHPAIILQAAETDRRRGYPCNVALSYLREHPEDFDLLCFLDDDDQILPGFAERLIGLMRARDADLVYGMSNALPESGEPSDQHRIRPPVSLLAGNFITFNSFLVRVDRVLALGAQFNEELHYLEDYDFLLQLLQAKLVFEPLMETVSEYRLIGDGNAVTKSDSEHFKFCQRKVRERIRTIAGSLSDDDFWADILAFPDGDGLDLGDHELNEIINARKVIAELGVDRG